MHQPATIRLAAWASAAVLALAVASCSSDNGTDPLSTLTDPPTTTTAPPTTTATTSTTAVTTTQAPDATTVPPTTPAPSETGPAVTLTNSIAPLPPEVEAAIYATFEREQELFYEPTAPDIDSRIAEVAEAGSQYESGLRQTLAQLQADGAKFSPSQQPNNQLNIERVSYDGGAEATVQICEISNDRKVSAADPTIAVDESWDGRLNVARTTIEMHRSDDGRWLRAVLVNVEGFRGVDTCPAEP